MNPYGGINVGERQGLSGYILAVVQFKAFFNQVVQQQGLSNIQLQVSDVSEAEPFTLFGQTIVSANRLDTVTELDFFYRQWQLKFAELDPCFFKTKVGSLDVINWQYCRWRVIPITIIAWRIVVN